MASKIEIVCVHYLSCYYCESNIVNIVICLYLLQKSDGSSSGGTTVCTCKSPVTAKRSSSIRVSSGHSTPDHGSYTTESPRKNKTRRRTTKRPRPKTVEELLDRLGLQVFICITFINFVILKR